VDLRIRAAGFSPETQGAQRKCISCGEQALSAHASKLRMAMAFASHLPSVILHRYKVNLARKHSRLVLACGRVLAMEQVELQQSRPSLQHAHDGLEVSGGPEWPQLLHIRRNLDMNTHSEPQNDAAVSRRTMSCACIYGTGCWESMHRFGTFSPQPRCRCHSQQLCGQM